MAEYIEREAVEKIIEKGLNNPDKSKAYGYDAVEILAEVHYMDAADVVGVRHGEWIDMASIGIHHGFIYKCSVCGKEVEDNFISYHKFCLHCGAKMDGKENDDEQKS